MLQLPRRLRERGGEARPFGVRVGPLAELLHRAVQRGTVASGRSSVASIICKTVRSVAARGSVTALAQTLEPFTK